MSKTLSLYSSAGLQRERWGFSAETQESVSRVRFQAAAMDIHSFLLHLLNKNKLLTNKMTSHFLFPAHRYSPCYQYGASQEFKAAAGPKSHAGRITDLNKVSHSFQPVIRHMATCKEFFAGFKSIKKDIKPWGIPKVHFIKSEWDDWTDVNSPPWLFITWRVIYLIFCIFAVVQSMLDPHPDINYWFLFATNWTIFFQLIYCLLYIINMIRFYVRNGKGVNWIGSDLNWIDSCIWILFNFIGVTPYIVTLGYWAAIYNPKNPLHIPHKTMINHGINAIFTLIDTLLVAIPVHVTHAVYLVGFCSVYVIFTCLYEICGGPYPDSNLGDNYIYSFLNWREHPGRTVGVAALLAVIASVIYYVLWLLYLLRLLLVSKFCQIGSHVYARHKAEVDEEVNVQSSEELEDIGERI